MQIHELNGYSGALDDAYMAVDNGSDTGKKKIKDITDPLNARIDNIIAGPASSAQEVIDARLGADGVVYPSLGDAIRDQVTDLSDSINNLGEFTGNVIELFDKATTTGSISFIDGTNKDSYSYNNCKRSDYIEVKKDWVINYYCRNMTDNCIIAFYDTTKEYNASKSVEGTAALQSGTYTVPDAGYIRIACRADIANHSYIMTINGQIQALDAKIDNTISDIAYKPFVPFSTTITSDKMLLNNGNIIDYNGYSVTDYIDISGHDYVKVTGASNYSNGIACFYDSSKVFISCPLQAASGGTNTVYTDEAVAVPSTAKYLVVSGRGATTAEAKGQFGYALKGKWEGIKWLAFGDSLTDDRNTRATKRYFNYVQDATEIAVINAGVSGSGYCVDGEAAFGEDTNWHDRILTYNDTDFDVITFFGSFNDMSSGLSNGSVTDSGTTTKAGCINTTLDNLFSFKPLAIVGVVTPTPWQYSRPGEQYAEAYVSLLKEICAYRSIPCLDLFHKSLLRPWDATFRQLAYSRDGGGGTHPDENGHKIIAPRFEAFLDSLLFH